MVDPEISAETVQRQLQRLRDSSLFSHSRRYPLFLDYVVRKTLEGNAEELKERTVGVEAFGRPTDYDLNSDPVVRVTAGEVRKRLAQYYYEAAHQQELRIELRPGSYVPEFRFAATQPVAATLSPASDVEGPLPVPPRFDVAEAQVAAVQPEAHAEPQRGVRFWKSIALSLSIALALLAASIGFMHMHRASFVDEFWRPVIDAAGPVNICVGSVVAMVNSNAVAPPPSTISGHPLAVDPIAISDATVLSEFQQVLSTREKPSTLSSSTGTSFSDLQKGPNVLISGFNNQWTMRITEPLRFHLVRISTDEYAIVDRQDATHRWVINTAVPFTKMTTDYALIARFHDPTTDQFAVLAAGIGENGTLSAGRVLTDDKLLGELKVSRAFPRPEQNFEAVIETQIIDGKPGPPRILATHLW